MVGFKKFAILIVLLGILSAGVFELRFRHAKAVAYDGRCHYCQSWRPIGNDHCCFSYFCRFEKAFTVSQSQQPPVVDPVAGR